MRRWIFVLLCACGGGDAAPGVEIVSSAPSVLVPDDDTADDLTIVVRYHDGDADLGEGLAEIVDCRADGVVSTLVLPPIASQQAIAEGVAIRGELSLVVTDVGRVEADDVVPSLCAEAGIGGPPSDDEAVFCVVLIDRAGHRSAPACTEVIAVD